MQHVCRRNKQDVRQVVFNVEVMILERGVLRRIEHLKQSRRGIAAEVHRHLVDFVEHHDRILRAGFLHHLDDLARQGTDVGAAMAANLGFVAYAAEREPHKFAPRRFGDRFSK